MNKIIYKDLSYQIVGLAMEVYNELGYGFLEKVYENALILLFRQSGLEVKQQYPIKVDFRGQVVGEYIADIFVEDKIILELKTVDKIANIHKSQVLNYLRATNIKLGILLNFSKKKLEYERFII
jgi:GxxExxY protein